MSAGMTEKLNIGSDIATKTTAKVAVQVTHRGQRSQQDGSLPQRFRNGEKGTKTGTWARILKSLGIGTAPGESDALPICSFGPGGSYLVDWCARDAAEASRHNQARTLAAGIERFAECLTLDLKGWLLAEHPERQHRIDAAPETLDGCPLCGHENQWPDWFLKGRAAPDLKTIQIGLRVAEDLKQEISADPVVAAVVEEVRATRPANTDRTQKRVSPQEATEVLQHYNISAAIGKAEVKNEVDDSVGIAQQSVEKAASVTNADGTPEAGKINYAEGSWDTENAGPFLFRFSDNLEPVSFRLPNIREQSHDPNTQTAQNSDRDSGLSRSERVLTNDAGVGRSAQRLKGNRVRARRGARAERSASACPEQGSLFGNQSDGQAA